MLRKVTLLWVAGLLTIVPFGTYYLFFHAQRDEYAFLITFVLFWIFGFWGIAGPIIAALRVRSVMRAIEMAQSQGKLREILCSAQTQEAVIDLIAAENKLPRFLAERIYRKVVNRLSVAPDETPVNK